jgi:hypothetical protein
MSAGGGRVGVDGEWSGSVHLLSEGEWIPSGIARREKWRGRWIRFYPNFAIFSYSICFTHALGIII